MTGEWRHHDLLDLSAWSRQEIELVLETSKSLK